MTASMAHEGDRPSLRPTPPASGWVAFLAHFLFVLAGWTVTIKYVFPIAFAAAKGAPLSQHIGWDLWPIAHLWLGWALLRWPWYTRALAIGMALVEIGIIATLFIGFLADPQWTIWRTNWFINKLFILLCFVLILGTFTLGAGWVKGYGPTRSPSPAQEPSHETR